MILHIDGNINRYYVQTLCMIFFPGSTFGENEKPTEGIPEVTVSVYTDNEGLSETAFVSIRLNDKVCEATETVSLAGEAAMISVSIRTILGLAGRKRYSSKTPSSV